TRLGPRCIDQDNQLSRPGHEAIHEKLHPRRQRTPRRSDGLSQATAILRDGCDSLPSERRLRGFPQASGRGEEVFVVRPSGQDIQAAFGSRRARRGSRSLRACLRSDLRPCGRTPWSRRVLRRSHGTAPGQAPEAREPSELRRSDRQGDRALLRAERTSVDVGSVANCVRAAQQPAKASRQRAWACYLAFPDDEGAVAAPTKGANDASIPRAVVGEFCAPELPVPLRHRRARTTRVGMPEASVHEDRPTPRAVGDVRRAGKIAVAGAEAKPEGVEQTAYRTLGAGVLLSDAAEPRRGGGVNQKRRLHPPDCLGWLPHRSASWYG